VININFNCHINNNTVVSSNNDAERKDTAEGDLFADKKEKPAKKSSSYGSDDTYDKKFETPSVQFIKNK
jgi:hypothetical protein